MAHPFSARQMHFVVASAEQKWWGGCAWDSFGIMAALDQQVLVATTCLGCGRPLALLADPGAPPTEPYVAHFLIPAARWWDDVVRTCSTIRLACRPEHVERWAAAEGERVGAVVGLPTLGRLGKGWVRRTGAGGLPRRTP